MSFNVRNMIVAAAVAVLGALGSAATASTATTLTANETLAGWDAAGFNDATFTLTGTQSGATLSVKYEFDLVKISNDPTDANYDLWTIALKVTNLTADDPGNTLANRVVGIGFSTSPTSSMTSISDNDAANTWNYTNGFSTAGSTFDVCVWSGQNCNGGGDTGLADGGSSVIFTFDLRVADGTTSVEFTEFLARFQTVGTSANGWNDSAKCTATTTGTIVYSCGPPTPPVPVPGSLPLLASGLLLGGMILRRKNRKAA